MKELFIYHIYKTSEDPALVREKDVGLFAEIRNGPETFAEPCRVIMLTAGVLRGETGLLLEDLDEMAL